MTGSGIGVLYIRCGLRDAAGHTSGVSPGAVDREAIYGPHSEGLSGTKEARGGGRWRECVGTSPVACSA